MDWMEKQLLEPRKMGRKLMQAKRGATRSGVGSWVLVQGPQGQAHKPTLGPTISPIGAKLYLFYRVFNS